MVKLVLRGAVLFSEFVSQTFAPVESPPNSGDQQCDSAEDAGECDTQSRIGRKDERDDSAADNQQAQTRAQQEALEQIGARAKAGSEIEDRVACRSRTHVGTYRPLTSKAFPPIVP